MVDLVRREREGGCWKGKLKKIQNKNFTKKKLTKTFESEGTRNLNVWLKGNFGEIKSYINAKAAVLK